RRLSPLTAASMAAWLIQVPSGLRSAWLAQPVKKTATSERASAKRITESFLSGAAGRWRPAGDLFDDENRVHFDLRAARQGRHADGCARRVRLLEIFAHDLVDLGEVAQISQENVEFDDVLERAARGFGNRRRVFEPLTDLAFDAFDQLHAFRLQRDVPGRVDS